MGEPKPIRPRTLQLEYRFDRLLPDKLAHVYQLLVPDQTSANQRRNSESRESSLGSER